MQKCPYGKTTTGTGAKRRPTGVHMAREDKKYLHPKYSPVNRYARDIIGCLNHWVNGWVSWNMVLDRQGGPNWFKIGV